MSKTAGRDAIMKEAMSQGATESEASRMWIIFWIISTLLKMRYTAEQIAAIAALLENDGGES